MLSQKVGQSVCVIGKVTTNSPSGNEIKVQLSDSKEVTARLDGEQVHEPMEGYIQMIATVNQDLSLDAEAYVNLPGEIDLDIYNQAINVALQHPNLFSASEV